MLSAKEYGKTNSGHFGNGAEGNNGKQMIESKIVATDRLRRESRWAEASVWRDEKRKQLRADGQTKADSNEASWDAMIEQFPPLPPSEYAPTVGSSTDGLELVDVGPDDYDGQPDLARDTL